MIIGTTKWVACCDTEAGTRGEDAHQNLDTVRPQPVVAHTWFWQQPWLLQTTLSSTQSSPSITSFLLLAARHFPSLNWLITLWEWWQSGMTLKQPCNPYCRSMVIAITVHNTERVSSACISMNLLLHPSALLHWSSCPIAGSYIISPLSSHKPSYHCKSLEIQELIILPLHVTPLAVFDPSCYMGHPESLRNLTGLP